MMGHDEDESEHSHTDGCCSGSHNACSKAGQASPPHTSCSDSGNDEQNENDNEEDDPGQADLVFPAEYSLALAQLLHAHSSPIRVQDIMLQTDELKLDLAITMWKEGMLAVQHSHSKVKSKIKAGGS